MMENRNGLIVDAMVTQADGLAERDAGWIMHQTQWLPDQPEETPLTNRESIRVDETNRRHA